MRTFIFIIVLIMGGAVWAQKQEQVTVLRTQDSMPMVTMDQVHVVGFKNDESRSDYLRLKQDIYRVYPYAQVVALTLERIDSTLQTLSNPIAKEKYLKEQERLLKKRYKAPLKDLNTNEGKLLLKLIHRETDKNCYYLIKRFKSGFNARFWQTVGLVFGYDLKAGYDPNAPQNWAIEHIISRIERGH